jgi:hypothetical protein
MAGPALFYLVTANYRLGKMTLNGAGAGESSAKASMIEGAALKQDAARMR